MLAVAFAVKKEEDWRRFDFKSPAKLQQNCVLFSRVYKALAQAGLLTWPKVHVSEGLAEDVRARLQQIALAHGATVCADAGEASHIVHAPVEESAEGAAARAQR